MGILIDVNKLPRPERSGLIAILAFYILATGFGDVVNLPYAKEGGTLWSLACYVLPCSLFSFGHPGQADNSDVFRHRARWITFAPSMAISRGGRPCTCHWDSRMSEGDPIFHHHAIQEETCESADSAPSVWLFPKIWEDSTWTEIGANGKILSVVKKGQDRWHCTADDNK